MYKHIIFALGGVFLNLMGQHSGVPKQLSEALSIPESDAERLWKENREKLLTGKESPKQFLDRVVKVVYGNADMDEVHSRWKASDRVREDQINWQLVDYVEQLKKSGYLIHMLTDTIDLSRKTDPIVKEIDSHFHNVFKSYEEGIKKPDKEAFINALKKIKAEPDECVFVDDYESNVKAASELGITAVQFTTTENLKESFEELGIKIS
jgi:epoxide hydrolase-like predicted phosphatase